MRPDGILMLMLFPSSFIIVATYESAFSAVDLAKDGAISYLFEQSVVISRYKPVDQPGSGIIRMVFEGAGVENDDLLPDEANDGLVGGDKGKTKVAGVAVIFGVRRDAEEPGNFGRLGRMKKKREKSTPKCWVDTANACPT
ncbi:PREDICTED: uncharacterized protein LOC104760534 [Camelina sativa]|uniref:Uncharacterized protein LOC104760534 n=1 Tax=Camelina sativa TaxID=90675 RepID=A0ABM0X792_CAMSA|nr:PREDICTED: uncharacterized protein LOC104760534 [Camelina sativa]